MSFRILKPGFPGFLLSKIEYDSGHYLSKAQLSMKLSRTAWNNVIIISVMVIILLINVMNGRLFPSKNQVMSNDEGEHLILSAHAVILTLEVRDKFIIERAGQSWRIESQQKFVDAKQHVIEQMMLAWQRSSGLLQADNLEVSGKTGIEVFINVAGTAATKMLTLYPLVDQLLIHDKQVNLWFALSPQLYRQLLPSEIYSNEQ